MLPALLADVSLRGGRALAAAARGEAPGRLARPAAAPAPVSGGAREAVEPPVAGPSAPPAAPLRGGPARPMPVVPGDGPGRGSQPPPGRPGGGEAAAAFAAFNDAFYVEAAGRGFYRVRGASRRPVSFWQSAELIELAEDAAGASGDGAHVELVRALFRGVLLRYGRDWVRARTYNDDVMWMVLAAIRAYGLTGEAGFRELARANFERTYARAWSDDLGGGLWWTTARCEKNACVNGPAAVAAYLLAEALGDPSYLAVARRTYAWLRERLFEEATGRVNDRITVAADRSGEGIVNRGASTYNQGTLIGAADLLHRMTGEEAYRDDALRGLIFTRRELAPGGILRGEGDGGDGGGFKGIFARYAVPFVRRHRLTEYDAWLRRNAAAAWSRRDSRGLVPQDWAAEASSAAAGSARRSPPAAWDASSAVVLLQLATAPSGGGGTARQQ